jgi:hypothetical protein
MQINENSGSSKMKEIDMSSEEARINGIMYEERKKEIE